MLETKILFVEDDVSLGFVTKDNLEMNGFTIVHCQDGAQGWEAFQNQDFDLCILDVMLPKMDGFTLAQNIRQKNKDIPILFLTAKSMKDDRIKGLKLGADDYITKPFSIEELVLKIEVFLKRSKINSARNVFQIGKYTFDFDSLALIYQSTTNKMTFREAEVLRFFCINMNKIVARDEILNQIWGNDDYFTGRSLDVFISRLRKYFKDDPAVKIENVHGVGFRMSVEP